VATLEAEQDRAFIHLRNARCFVAGQVVTHHSHRVRLSDVSAWTVAGVEERQSAPTTLQRTSVRPGDHRRAYLQIIDCGVPLCGDDRRVTQRLHRPQIAVLNTLLC
jgi:hypothetical protein